MTYQSELKEAYKKYGERIKNLYKKYNDVKQIGVLDGEPWAHEERALKSALLTELQEINKKYEKQNKGE